jgi:hypothetical protein
MYTHYPTSYNCIKWRTSEQEGYFIVHRLHCNLMVKKGNSAMTNLMINVGPIP